MNIHGGYPNFNSSIPISIFP